MLNVAGQAVSWLEVVAAVAGLASVWLAQRIHIANWPAGMVSVLCLTFVFFEAKLYADALLQVALFGLGGYGWWRWTNQGRVGHVIAVVHAGLIESGISLALAAAATAACATVLMRFTDSPAPWPDAAMLVFSLIALAAQAHGRVECWLVWIMVDVIAIPLYLNRGLPLTAALYVVFLLLCIGGWRKWKRRIGRAK